MLKRIPLSRLPLEQALPWLVLAILLTYTYAFFFQAAYPGFIFTPSPGTIKKVFVTSPPDASLQVADRLIQIGPVAWADYKANSRQTLFDGVQPGQIVPIVIERQGRPLTIPWVFPGPNQAEVEYRLNSEWFLAYIFWLAGTATLLFLRPKDTRWRLLIAFNFLTALWLEAGTLSRWQIWESQIVFHAVIWLSLPVYWHLHWLFPQPLGRLPGIAWGIAYSIGGLLAIAEWFQFLPTESYLLGFLLALVGSVILLMAHFILQPAQRRDVGFLVLAVGLVLAPSIAISLAGTFSSLPINSAGALLTFPILPFAYLYAAYRRQLGGLEIRANQLIASYIFFTLLGAALILLIAAADSQLDFPGKVIFIGIITALLAALVTALSLGSFQRFVERRILGIPLPPSHLLEAYAARITVSLDTQTLVNLLTKEILSSLLIRQSALLRLEAGKPVTFYADNVTADQLPRVEDLPDLLAQAGKYRSLTEEALRPCPWVRLILPLRIEQKLIGLWLLGRRDPDDFYSQAEIDILQSLAHQTAIALVNILQAERLHALYQADIDRVETQRASLARELHDHVLNQLAILKTSLDEQADEPRFRESYETVVASLRQTISGLRPAALNYGLGAALTDLADALAERYEPGPEIVLELPEAGARYDPHLEQHIYRIIQQACENALQHAQPQTIKILGKLEPGQIDLTVEDDGVGFNSDEQLDLARLATGKHFGLAGMFERAALVNAQVQIESAPGQGTRVRVRWTANNGTANNG
jgi:signal transduction histidine kinase